MLVRVHMLFSWRIAVNHVRNEDHQPPLASRLRPSKAKCNPPPWSIKTRRSRRYRPSAPESAHQQWGESPLRTEHWLSVVEGNCVAREGGVESNRRRTASP